MSPLERDRRTYNRSMAALLAVAVALLVIAFTGECAHAAPARHSGSPAACEAHQRASVTLGDDEPHIPYSAADIAQARALGLEDIAVSHERQNASYIANFNPHATRDLLSWSRVQQRCYGRDMGLDKPMPRIVEVTVTNTVTISR